MFIRSMTTLLVPAFLLAGCNIHPLPEDISKDDTTYQIVRKVRCEARDAIRNIAISQLLDGSDDDKHLAKRLTDKKLTFLEAYRKDFSQETKQYFDRYENAAIAYDFQLNITETNNNELSVKFLKPFSNGSRSIGLGGGVELSRRNDRSFRIADKFADLAVSEATDRYCSIQSAKVDIVYPLTGRIGLSEALDTFIKLNEFGNLSSNDDKTSRKFADLIEFTTKLMGSFSPKFSIEEPKAGFHLSEASLTNANSRTDTHTVTFSLSLPPSEKEIVQAKRSSAQTKPTTKPTAVTAKDLAIEELDRQQGLRLNRSLEKFLNKY
ncbi:hypothetical protein ASF70_16975 [Rhizobium sp. Leaf321]|nr:hypothetical protein ASF70_16975 [Rhizobium sp. Leaf321]